MLEYKDDSDKYRSLDQNPPGSHRWPCVVTLLFFLQKCFSKLLITFIRHSVFYLQKLKILWNVSDKFVWRKLFQLLYDPAYYQQQKLDKHQNKSIKENISRKLLKKLSEIFLMFTGFLFKLSSFQAQTSVGMSLPGTKLIYPHTKQTPIPYIMWHFAWTGSSHSS